MKPLEFLNRNVKNESLKSRLIIEGMSIIIYNLSGKLARDDYEFDTPTGFLNKIRTINNSAIQSLLDEYETTAADNRIQHILLILLEVSNIDIPKQQEDKARLLSIGREIINRDKNFEPLIETITFLMGCGFVSEYFQLEALKALSDLHDSEGDISCVMSTISEFMNTLSEDVNS